MEFISRNAIYLRTNDLVERGFYGRSWPIATFSGIAAIQLGFGVKRTFSEPRLQDLIYEYAPIK